jgi:hypothetical protein
VRAQICIEGRRASLPRDSRGKPATDGKGNEKELKEDGTPRSGLVAELAELHNLQFKALADATFVGWTRDHMVDYQKRSDRISAVQRELDALDGTSDWSRPLWPL